MSYTSEHGLAISSDEAFNNFIEGIEQGTAYTFTPGFKSSLVLNDQQLEARLQEMSQDSNQ
ncbi:hypothetical protein CRD60_05415 [Bifidobacterium aemilianum]|uniref:Uncharacterized protein n=1 Tax=Bifidobacterium aemilianum TaxID=2493120 RepID=A0A366K7G6_9BIFI|nr:hypothetical protein [Bifidobacterium aemilianum]RBP97676.1 hypothetical protein CRD60_05415 [Bifidobacterium aemilianum]